MKKNLNRRTFLTASLSGIGMVAAGNTLVNAPVLSEFSDKQDNIRKLFATTDYFDNVIINERGPRYGKPVARSAEFYEKNKCFMDRSQLDELHRFLASAGFSRHHWIVDTIWKMYEDYPHRFDLLAEAVQSAHSQGLEFFAEIKPFEGGGFGQILPLTMPFPDERVAFRDLRGIIPLAQPFAAGNVEMNLKRRPGSPVSGAIKAIRLVKGDDLPIQIRPEQITILSSATNNRFIPCKKPFRFRETIEKRYRFPYWRKCRILHLEDLEIPEGHRYLLIRCNPVSINGNFSNETGNILELVGNDDTIFPHTLSTGQVRLEDHYDSFYRSDIVRKNVRYLQHPQVQAEISDRQKMEEHYRDFYSFGEYSFSDWITFDKEGYLAAALGKPEYMAGNLNPVYPEVRKHWLDLVRFCLDRGVDGINFRVGNHTRLTDYWEYGFNEPVLKMTKGKTDCLSIGRINGDAYTQFLREARELIKSYGKSLTIHLETAFLMPEDRPGKLNSLPPNFDWQWETWVKEIGDAFEIRGIYELRPWNFEKVIEIFGTATRAAGKPLYLQGDFHGMAYDGPFFSTGAEINLVNNHQDLDGYVFYETANVTRLLDDGHIEGSDVIKSILKNLKFNK